MQKVDQFAAMNAFPPENYKYKTQVEWKKFKDSIYTNHKNKIEVLFNKYGFLGIEKFGKENSDLFFLFTQHSDKFPDFQEKVLEKMKIEIKNNNANPKNYPLLYDRVMLNTGRKQLYATQLTYNKLGQATPKPLEDSINVDKRRFEFKLDDLKTYLNEMTIMHFEMGKESYIKMGIKEAILYK
jgi:hypothetical protein